MAVPAQNQATAEHEIRRPGIFPALRRSEYFVVASVVVFIAGMVILAANLGLQDVIGHIRSISPEVVCGLLALSLVNYGIRIVRWNLFARRVKIIIPFKRMALYFVAGFAMTTTPGKVGEALRLWLMQRCHGCRYRRAAPLLLGDRIGDANAIMLLCLIGLASYTDYLWLTLVGTAVLAAMSALLYRPRFLVWLLLAAYGAIKRAPRIFAALRTALRHTASLFDPAFFTVTLALGMVGWFAECVAFYWVLNELGAQVTLQQAMFVFAFSMLVGVAVMLPGGLGGTEATMIVLLTALGVDADVALAATAIIRVTTLWFAVILGFTALPFALRGARRATAPFLNPAQQT